MLENHATAGSIQTSDHQKRLFAAASRRFNRYVSQSLPSLATELCLRANPKFVKMFPDLVGSASPAPATAVAAATVATTATAIETQGKQTQDLGTGKKQTTLSKPFLLALLILLFAIVLMCIKYVNK
jgi:hypothetical protein